MALGTVSSLGGVNADGCPMDKQWLNWLNRGKVHQVGPGWASSFISSWSNSANASAVAPAAKLHSKEPVERLEEAFLVDI